MWRNARERRDSLYHRLLESFALGSYEGSGGVYHMEARDADSMVTFSESVDSVDRERAAFIKNYFGADWPNHLMYHDAQYRSWR